MICACGNISRALELKHWFMTIEDFAATADFITNSEGEEYDNGTKK